MGPKLESQIILQDVKMAICDAPEHKAAVVAGVDDAQKAIHERPRTEQLQQISSTKGLASQGMRNGAAKPPYADYALAGALQNGQHLATVIDTEKPCVASNLWTLSRVSAITKIPFTLL